MKISVLCERIVEVEKVIHFLPNLVSRLPHFLGTFNVSHHPLPARLRTCVIYSPSIGNFPAAEWEESWNSFIAAFTRRREELDATVPLIGAG